MSMTQELLKARMSLENNLRELLGVPVFLIEMDAFALPCECGGVTINTRGLQLDDLEIFEEHILKYLTDTVKSLDVEASFLFARLIPGTAEVASINARILCNSCYMDFGRGTGKQPRPDIYIMRFDRRE